MVQAFAKADIQATDTQGPEYSVYIYHRPENQHEGQNDWEMRSTTYDLNAAINEAVSLHESEGYRKVEIKKRLFDPETSAVKDQVLKVFMHEKVDIPLEAKLALCSVLLCVGVLSLVYLGLI
ncbi:MAG: hypothetical protein JKY71_02195 [Alphaproteobacteria bacterium]|nr:hypothetical protein [Alphaproteobacteria bacterium]